jgi:hypothetical protein
MENENLEGEIGRRSARIYLPISFGAAALFFLAAGWAGETALAPRLGGAFWIGLLTLIVSMPLVTARVKKARREGSSG